MAAIQITTSLLLFCSVCVYTADTLQVNATSNETDVFLELLTNYDKTDLPIKDRANRVVIGLYAQSIYGISEQDMEFCMNFYLHMNWKDPRIATITQPDVTSNFQEQSLPRMRKRAPEFFLRDVWTPDLYLRNEIVKASGLEAMQSLTLSDVGEVWYVIKSTVTLSCPMVLLWFPFDTQVCSVVIESFGYGKEQLRLSWMRGAAVEVDPNLSLPEFTLQNVITKDCTDMKSCVKAEFVLKRDIGYYVLQVFIPSTVLVLISWVQFWLSPDSITARLLVGLFCTFTLVAQMTGLRSSLPRVSYLTSLDIWMLVSLLFTTAALMQLVIVAGFSQWQKKRHHTNSPQLPIEADVTEPKSTGISTMTRVDRVSRMVFPILFFVFCALYWGILCLGGWLWLQKLVTTDIMDFLGDWRLRKGMVKTL